MAEIFPTLGIWVWWIIAGLLLILELLLAGIFFVWLGIAAAVMGLVDFLAPPLDWQVEIAIFAVLSAVLVIAGRPWLKRRQAVDSDRPHPQPEDLRRRWQVVRAGRGHHQWPRQGQDRRHPLGGDRSRPAAGCLGQDRRRRRPAAARRSRDRQLTAR